MAKLEGYKYITYLIGSMEKTAEGDDGSSKREKLQEELLIRKVYPINPVQLEKYKINISTDKAKKQMNEWLKNKEVSPFKDFSRLIWKGKYFIDKKYGLIHIPGDIEYVTMSDWITCVFNKGDRPCVDKNTQVYLTDFSTKNIKDLKVKDKILGFKKEKDKTYFTESIVLDVLEKGKKETFQYINDNGNTIYSTPDHEFLTPNRKKGSIYRPVSTIKETFAVPFIEQNEKFNLRYLCGYFQNFAINTLRTPI